MSNSYLFLSPFRKRIICGVLATGLILDVRPAQASFWGTVAAGVAGYALGRALSSGGSSTTYYYRSDYDSSGGGGGYSGSDYSYYPMLDSGTTAKSSAISEEVKAINAAADKISGAIEKNGAPSVLSPDERERMRKYYNLDKMGPAIGININGAGASQLVRENGIDAFQNLIETRIMNFKINTVLAGALLLGTQDGKPLELRDINDFDNAKESTALVDKIAKIGDLKIAFEMIDKVRKNPKKTVKELLDDIDSDSGNKFITKKKNIFPNENRLNEESNHHLKALLIQAIKADQAAGGLDFNTITYNNVDAHPEVLIGNANHLMKTVRSVLAEAKSIQERIAKLSQSCSESTTTLDNIAKTLQNNFHGSHLRCRHRKSSPQGPLEYFEYCRREDDFEMEAEHALRPPSLPSTIDSSNLDEVEKGIDKIAKYTNDFKKLVGQFNSLKANVEPLKYSDGSILYKLQYIDDYDIDKNDPRAKKELEFASTEVRATSSSDLYRKNKANLKLVCSKLETVKATMGTSEEVEALRARQIEPTNAKDPNLIKDPKIADLQKQIEELTGQLQKAQQTASTQASSPHEELHSGVQ